MLWGLRDKRRPTITMEWIITCGDSARSGRKAPPYRSRRGGLRARRLEQGDTAIGSGRQLGDDNGRIIVQRFTVGKFLQSAAQFTHQIGGGQVSVVLHEINQTPRSEFFALQV